MDIGKATDELAEKLEADTLFHICQWVASHNLSDKEFSESAGLHKITWGKIARYDISLSFKTIWKIASYYGYEAVGDIWAPYPDAIFTPYPYEDVIANVQTKINIFKKVLKIRKQPLTILREKSGFGHDHFMKILRGETTGIHLRTVAGLTLILELDRPGDLFKTPEDFFELYCQ